MPRQKNRLPASVRDSENHTFALTCAHCNDTCDSFGRYVSTYCHRRNEHLMGFEPGEPFPCRECPDYERRPGR